MILWGDPLPRRRCCTCTWKQLRVLLRIETVGEEVLVGQNRTRCVSRVHLGVWLASFIFMLAWAGTIQANWISDFPSEPGILESSTNPVISNWFLNVGYDGAGNFSVSSQYPGIAVLNNFSDSIYDIGADSTLNIAMSIDPQTGAPRGGALTVTGEASSYYTSKSSGNLLTGTITQFGFAGPIDAANSAGKRISNSFSKPPAATWPLSSPASPLTSTLLRSISMGRSETLPSSAIPRPPGRTLSPGLSTPRRCPNPRRSCWRRWAFSAWRPPVRSDILDRAPKENASSRSAGGMGWPSSRLRPSASPLLG